MRGWVLPILCLLAPIAVSAETIRIATFNASLTREGPGMLLRAIEKEHGQVGSVLKIIRHIDADILLINEFDYDPEGRAAHAFLAGLSEGDNGVEYRYSFTTEPNTGQLSGFDLDGDGKTAGPNDAFGYGKFPGQYGMLLISKFPILEHEARSFAKMLWSDLPGAVLPSYPDGTPFPSVEAQAIMRLSSKSHWDVPVDTTIGRIHIFASHPTPPVFDGPEDRNGLRNAAEVQFWTHYLDGLEVEDDAGQKRSRTDNPFVVMGDLNADPADGDGNHRELQRLLEHPTLQDPKPTSEGAAAAAATQGGANSEHKGSPANDTADWRDNGGPGNLRVDYVLPSQQFNVVDAGVFWPDADDPLAEYLGTGKSTASDHRLVWVDVELSASE